MKPAFSASVFSMACLRQTAIAGSSPVAASATGDLGTCHWKTTPNRRGSRIPEVLARAVLLLICRLFDDPHLLTHRTVEDPTDGPWTRGRGPEFEREQRALVVDRLEHGQWRPLSWWAFGYSVTTALVILMIGVGRGVHIANRCELLIRV